MVGVLYCDVYATIVATLRTIFEYQYTIFLCVVCMHRSITASCSMVVCIVVRHTGEGGIVNPVLDN